MKVGKLLGLFVAAGVGVATAAAVEWNVVPHDNRDYVTFKNVAEFYHFTGYTQASRTVSLRGEHRSISAQGGSSELYINGVRFFTFFPLREASEGQLISAFDVGKLIEPILRPSRIPNAQRVETVILDSGHGGPDQGASSSWGTEKEFALDVALNARNELLHAGYKVEMTRFTDNGLTLEERVEFANRFPNAVFVSIHFNSGVGGNGIESYALAPEGVVSNAASGEAHASVTDTQPDPGNAQDPQNLALAAAVHAAVLSRLSPYDRGVRHARFKVLRDIRIPALLFEGGFLNDPREGGRIATPQYRQQLGAAIAQGVQSYNTAVNHRASDSSFAVLRGSLPPHAKSITEPLRLEPPAMSASAPVVLSRDDG